MMTTSGIYAISSPSGKCYVGSSHNIKQRWLTHRSLLDRHKHHCRGLQNAYDKYGASLVYEIIELCSVAQLIVREQFHINSRTLRKLYNTNPIAGTTLGFKMSTETRKLMSEKGKGRVKSQETRKRLADVRRGVKLAEAHCENIRLSKIGTKASEETRIKMSQAQLSVVRSNNKSGIRGVFYNKKSRKWAACIYVDKVANHLGYFDNLDAAAEAVRCARNEMS